MLFFELCPLCKHKGKNSRLKSLQINFHEFIWICEKTNECSYPLCTNDFKVYKREVKGKLSSTWQWFKVTRSRNVLAYLDTPPATPSLDENLSSSASTSSNESLPYVSPTCIDSIAADIGEDHPKLSWPNMDILKNVKIDTVSSNKEPLSKAVQEYFKKRNIPFESQINLPKINENVKLDDPKAAEKNMPEIMKTDDFVPEIKSQPGQSSEEDDDLEIVKFITAVPKVTENILKRKMDVGDHERSVKRKVEARKLTPFTMEDIKKDIEKGRREAFRLKHKNTKTVNEKPDVIVIDDDDENDKGYAQKKANGDCAEKCVARNKNSSADPLFGINQVSEKTFAESEIAQVNSSIDPKLSGNQVLERPANSEVEVTQANLPTTIVNSEVPVTSSEIPQEKVPFDENCDANEFLDEYLDSCYSGDCRPEELMELDDDFFIF